MSENHSQQKRRGRPPGSTAAAMQARRMTQEEVSAALIEDLVFEREQNSLPTPTLTKISENNRNRQNRGNMIDSFIAEYHQPPDKTIDVEFIKLEDGTIKLVTAEEAKAFNDEDVRTLIIDLSKPKLPPVRKLSDGPVPPDKKATMAIYIEVATKNLIEEVAKLRNDGSSLSSIFRDILEKHIPELQAELARLQKNSAD